MDKLFAIVDPDTAEEFFSPSEGLMSKIEKAINQGAVNVLDSKSGTFKSLNMFDTIEKPGIKKFKIKFIGGVQADGHVMQSVTVVCPSRKDALAYAESLTPDGALYEIIEKKATKVDVAFWTTHHRDDIDKY